MKRFHFRLQKVLNLRSQETDQVRRAFGIALAEEEEARRVVQRAQTMLDARLAEIQHKERSGMTGFDFGALRSHIGLLQRRLEEAAASLAVAEERTLTCRAELLEARRRERALERLRERRLETYHQERLHEEQKELDQFGDRQGLNTRLSRSDI